MRILEIQGLRALASILVLIYHAKFVPDGFIEVDIFYAISSFLITGLILKELDATGKLALKISTNAELSSYCPHPPLYY